MASILASSKIPILCAHWDFHALTSSTHEVFPDACPYPGSAFAIPDARFSAFSLAEKRSLVHVHSFASRLSSSQSHQPSARLACISSTVREGHQRLFLQDGATMPNCPHKYMILDPCVEHTMTSSALHIGSSPNPSLEALFPLQLVRFTPSTIVYRH